MKRDVHFEIDNTQKKLTATFLFCSFICLIQVMSQKETGGTSEMKPPQTPAKQPQTPAKQPRPPGVLPRAPWSMSHLLRGPRMMNMPPFYHMIHVPSPMAIVNTQSMFMSPPPNIQHHSNFSFSYSFSLSIVFFI